MTPEQYATILDLHRAAVGAATAATEGRKTWLNAHAADKAFTDALQALVVEQAAS